MRVVCDLPYMTENRALDIEFKAEYLYAERLATGMYKREEHVTKQNEPDMKGMGSLLKLRKSVLII